jgi:hypothetical protein
LKNMSSYETEEERIRRHIRTELSRKDRFKNWWYYHRHIVLICAAVLLLAGYLCSEYAVAEEEDYSVAWVGRQYLSEEAAAFLENALAAYGTDLNGDGETIVRIRQFALDIQSILSSGAAAGQQEYGDLLALNSDLSCGQSILFLLEDPEAFQDFCGALLYLDGSEPEQGASDWENMVMKWSDILPVSSLMPETEIYLACRGCWMDEQQETWNHSRALWDNLFSEVSK